MRTWLTLVCRRPRQACSRRSARGHAVDIATRTAALVPRRPWAIYVAIAVTMMTPALSQSQTLPTSCEPSLVLSDDQFGGFRSIALNGSIAFLTPDLKIVNIPLPSDPFLMSSLDLPGEGLDIQVSDGVAYITCMDVGLCIVDVSNPTAPELLNTIPTPGNAQRLDVVDGFAYIADGDAGLTIIDVQDPGAASMISTTSTSGIAFDVEVDGDVVFIANGQFGGLLVLDASNPAAPELIGGSATFGSARRVFKRADVLYVSIINGGLEVFDVSDPHRPMSIGLDADIPFIRNVAWSGDLMVFAATPSGVQSAMDPFTPLLLHSFTGLAAGDVKIRGRYAYFAGGGGLDVHDLAPCMAAEDLNTDGVINGADLAILLASWGGVFGDINGDGVTNGVVLALLLASWS